MSNLNAKNRSHSMPPVLTAEALATLSPLGESILWTIAYPLVRLLLAELANELENAQNKPPADD
jgi:hypothetical protein